MNFLKTIHSYIVKTRYNLLFYILINAVVFSNFLLFFYLVGQRLNLLYNPYQFFSCFIVTLPYFFMKKRKGTIFVFLFAINVIVLSNMLYYRTYFSMMPLQSFTLVSNLNGLGDSIIDSFRLIDFFFFAPTAFAWYLYFRRLKNHIEDLNFGFRISVAAMVLCCFILMFSIELWVYHRETGYNVWSRYEQISYDQVNGARVFGFVSCWIWQIYDYLPLNDRLTAHDRKEIDDWLSINSNYSQIKNDSVVGKNLIIIIVESLESWPINSTVNNTQITPHINRLLQTQSCLYAPKVVPQVSDGRSSDTQLMVNAGLLPINIGATLSRFPDNKYYSLAKALRNHSYHTSTFVGNHPSFWNQGRMSYSFGYEQLESSLTFRMDDQFGFGLSDSSFFCQSAEKMQNISQPFCVQMITLSSHGPFKIPKEKIKLTLPDDCNEKLYNYLTAINYFDEAFGRFVEVLQKANIFHNSMIVIIGDHAGLLGDIRKKIMESKYGKELVTQEAFIPFIVINSPENIRYGNIMGQIDIYPTLLDILALHGYKWKGLGTSIFNNGKYPLAIDKRLKIIGDTTNVLRDKLDHITSAWKISDMIIRGNYFERVQ
jgi:phosphoglycerol transferase MdoB-like AlkP superfamily enzyme